jgi:hypothetical protein
MTRIEGGGGAPSTMQVERCCSGSCSSPCVPSRRHSVLRRSERHLAELRSSGSPLRSGEAFASNGTQRLHCCGSHRFVIDAARLPPSVSHVPMAALCCRFSSRPRRCELPSLGRRLGGPMKSGFVHGFGLDGPQNRCPRWARSFRMLVRRTGALRNDGERFQPALTSISTRSIHPR